MTGGAASPALVQAFAPKAGDGGTADVDRGVGESGRRPTLRLTFKRYVYDPDKRMHRP